MIGIVRDVERTWEGEWVITAMAAVLGKIHIRELEEEEIISELLKNGFVRENVFVDLYDMNAEISLKNGEPVFIIQFKEE